MKGETGGTIAVWDLDDLSLTKGAQRHLGEILSGKIIEVLKNRDYVVVERQRLLLALEELRLGTTQLVDEATRLKLGKMLGVKRMVFGGYQIIGDQMRLDLRLVEVETGKVKKAVQKMSSAAHLEGWIESAKRAAEEL
jgi:TolB-like protein